MISMIGRQSIQVIYLYVYSSTLINSSISTTSVFLNHVFILIIGKLFSAVYECLDICHNHNFPLISTTYPLSLHSKIEALKLQLDYDRDSGGKHQFQGKKFLNNVFIRFRPEFIRRGYMYG